MSSDSSVPRPPERRSQTAPREPRGGTDPIAQRVADGPSAPAGGANGDATQSTERPIRLRRDDVGQVVAFPQPGTHRRRRVDDPRGDSVAPPESAPVLAPVSAPESAPVDAPVSAPERAPAAVDETPVERPAYLASELLKQDWFPGTPLRQTLRWGALGVGGAGALGVLAVGGTSAGALLMAAALTACALVGALPLAASTRGVVLAIVATLGAALAGSLRMIESADPGAPLLVGCISVAASALFFRAAHRTSRLARTLVGVGVGATGLWLVLTGGVDALLVTSMDWQAWAGPTLRVALGAVVVSSLLTFVDPTGHGGAWGAGGALLVWLLLDSAAAVALALWPVRPAGDVDLGDTALLATLACPFLTAMASMGLCQVWVLVSRPLAQGKRETPLSRVTLGA